LQQKICELKQKVSLQELKDELTKSLEKRRNEKNEIAKLSDLAETPGWIFNIVLEIL